VSEAQAPSPGSLGQPIGRHPVQRCVVLKDVRPLGQAVLRSRDDQIVAVDRTPRPADMHDPGRTAGSLADPACHWLVLATGAEHDSGPGRLQRGRGRGLKPRKGGYERWCQQNIEGPACQLLGLERQPQALGKGQDLRSIAGALRLQHPDRGGNGLGNPALSPAGRTPASLGIDLDGGVPGADQPVEADRRAFRPSQSRHCLAIESSRLAEAHLRQCR
jgi:hypothetical protein